MLGYPSDRCGAGVKCIVARLALSVFRNADVALESVYKLYLTIDERPVTTKWKTRASRERNAESVRLVLQEPQLNG